MEETSYEVTLCLASAHALVLLDDGVVGDPMEKAALDALKWKLTKGDNLSPSSDEAKHRANVSIRRRFQFSSALKRMSTISYVTPFGRDAKKHTFVAVKGAPETLKAMYTSVPPSYETTYKWYAQRGSRVLALGYKWNQGLDTPQVRLSTSKPSLHECR